MESVALHVAIAVSVSLSLSASVSVAHCVIVAVYLRVCLYLLLEFLCVEFFNFSCLHFELAPNICTTFCDRLTNFSFSFGLGLGLGCLWGANQRIA